MNMIIDDPRFTGIEPFREKVWLSSPTMHGEEQRWVDEAIQTNWVSTIGSNIDSVEKQIAELVGVKYAVGLSSGTSALHLATRLAGEKLYGQPKPNEGTLKGHRVFCSDMTFSASVNPVSYENGEPVFIDTEYDTWNMSPEALQKAFELYPDVKLIVLVHLYGTPGKMEEIIRIANDHDALIVEDAAEAIGARYKMNGNWVDAGSMGDYNCISFNGNKIITGSSGGMFLTDDKADADRIRKWSTQSRETAPWYQHKEVGYNYRMSNIVAGVIRGQIPYISDHIEQKKAIYNRYAEGLRDLPVKMNPFDYDKSIPNHWLSCMIIDPEAMSQQMRSDDNVTYKKEAGKSCPSEILDALTAFNAEGRPIWKPMHLQPLFKAFDFVFDDNSHERDVGSDIFNRGLCLPSDNKMTPEAQRTVIDIIHRCFV